MKSLLLAAVLFLLAVTSAWAQEQKYPKAKVSYEDFKGLVAEVEQHRAKRKIDLDTFLQMSKEEDVIILDARSAFRFERIHVKGAKNLSFSDFTQESLAKVIPSFKTKILIYCNNNFEGNQIDFMSKSVRPITAPLNDASKQFSVEAKPLMLALNVPTFINLYGYGYRNVYELHELVNVNDPRIVFEGSTVEQKSASAAP